MLVVWSMSAVGQNSSTIGGDFTLTDHESNHFELQQLRGKVVLMYFGYTHCPDICPVELAGMAQYVESLGAQKDSVKVLFVTVDPVRDTPERLKEYMGFFHDDFIGLSGSEDEIDQVKKSFMFNLIYFVHQIAMLNTRWITMPVCL